MGDYGVLSRTDVAIRRRALWRDGEGAGADFAGTVPTGLPPPGLPAHVYMGKGYGMRAGFNSATYGGCDPWLTKGGGRGRGGAGPSREPG